MNLRQEKILAKLVELYTTSAEPVSSGKLAKFFHLSSATLRNEMTLLEEEGYIEQPHISAGRVPSEKGYKLFVNQYLNKEGKVNRQQKEEIREVFLLAKNYAYQAVLKAVAKKLAEISNQTIIIAFQYNDIFYTGVSNLFSKPEFSDLNCVYNLSVIIDKMDESIMEIFGRLDYKINIFIGHDNPLGDKCSSILTKYNLLSDGQEQIGLIGLLGPMRMPYSFNRDLLAYTRELINNSYKGND